MLGAGAPGARAQEVNLASLEEEGANRLSVRTGAEYGFVAGLGYARSVHLLGRTLLLTGDLDAPWAGVDVSDFRVRAGVLVPLARFGGWRLAGSLAPTLRATENDLGRQTSLGADVGVTGGYYARHWFLAAETGFDWSMTTHIEHGDGYRAHAYQEAKDGWYANPGGNLRYGVQTGASFGRHDLVLRAGALRDDVGSAPLLPFYGTLAFVTRW